MSAEWRIGAELRHSPRRSTLLLLPVRWSQRTVLSRRCRVSGPDACEHSGQSGGIKAVLRFGG